MKESLPLLPRPSTSLAASPPPPDDDGDDGGTLPSLELSSALFASCALKVHQRRNHDPRHVQKQRELDKVTYLHGAVATLQMQA
eukprot:CAMPEP_0185269698 /NCGR_PEP_ID=MMETSP1359-20130426/40541_1 /TAXON_ID=552665 /ORGANISM="Bigelowiella longifila, Strain CCMP242" /LENGTH=83 /DNA_ID=CAMNT_0027860981 /DNA_START=395 /DNA_END=645 /DNA_ORIENTATION=+